MVVWEAAVSDGFPSGERTRVPHAGSTREASARYIEQRCWTFISHRLLSRRLATVGASKPPPAGGGVGGSRRCAPRDRGCRAFRLRAWPGPPSLAGATSRSAAASSGHVL